MADIRKRTGTKGTTYQVRYPSKTTKSGYTYATFNTLKEARAFLESGSLRKGGQARSGDVRTVAAATDMWLRICEKEGPNGREPVTNYTYENYEYRAAFIKAYEWPKALADLTAPDVVAFRSWLLSGEVSRDIIALLAAADRLANSKNKLTAKTWRRYRPMLYLAVDSGMRPQEYLAASRSALRDNGIYIDRAIEGGGSEISVTKTPAGRRFIELSPDTLDMVGHYANHAADNKYDLIFPSESGRWQSRRNWQRRGFNIACEEAGLVETVTVDGEDVEQAKYRPYDLRHFFASMLIEKKTNLKKIQALMGHTNIETTLNVYGHLLEDSDRDKTESSALLSGMLAKTCGESVARQA
jgi:integrase